MLLPGALTATAPRRAAAHRTVLWPPPLEASRPHLWPTARILVHLRRVVKGEGRSGVLGQFQQTVREVRATPRRHRHHRRTTGARRAPHPPDRSDRIAVDGDLDMIGVGVAVPVEVRGDRPPSCSSRQPEPDGGPDRRLCLDGERNASVPGVLLARWVAVPPRQPRRWLPKERRDSRTRSLRSWRRCTSPRCR